jgi:hypothetical protein
MKAIKSALHDFGPVWADFPPAMLHLESFLSQGGLLIGGHAGFNRGKQHPFFPANVIFESLPKRYARSRQFADELFDLPVFFI